jgi:hypothetical protein
MAIELSVLQGYCTVGEADVYLENSANWSSATDEDKFDAVLDARYYLDVNFYCDLSSYDEIPDEMKYANAVLANDAIGGTGVFDHSPAVKLKKVKAGSVMSETEYTSGSRPSPPSFAKVKGILQGLCTRQNAAASTVELTRS